MSDFNFPEINWSDLHVSTNASLSALFLDACQGSYLVQHITSA